MSDDDGGFDPDALPTVGASDTTLPGTLELGAFSLSLNVADLGASLDFYTKLGFVSAQHVPIQLGPLSYAALVNIAATYSHGGA